MPATNRISDFGTPADASSRRMNGITFAAGVGRLRSSTIIAALFLFFANSEMRGVLIGSANARSIWASESAGASFGANTSTSQPAGKFNVSSSSPYQARVSTVAVFFIISFPLPDD